MQNTKKDTASFATNSETTRPNAENCNATNGSKLGKITDKPITVQTNRPNATLAANPTKRKIVGTELTQPTTNDPNVITHKNESQTPPSNKQQLNLLTNKKTNYTAPALWGNSRREGVFTRRPPIIYTTDTTAECTGTPTEDWLRQQAIGS